MNTPPAERECPNCHSDIPAASFCTLCGAKLGSRHRMWLRRATFAAAPREHVLRPGVTGALFPHLSARRRMPFRFGLVLLLAGLVAFAMMRIVPVMLAIAALGPPVLFGIYLVSARLVSDLPRFWLPLIATVGAALGVGWARLAGRLIGTGFGLPIPLSGLHHAAGVAAAVAGAILMVVPAVAARFLPASSRESLDGLAIGVAGALPFAAAATLTRLAAQFHSGVIPPTRPWSSVAVEAGLCGVAIPLTAAATGGVIGLALWLRPRPGRGSDARVALWSLGAGMLTIHAVVGGVDAAGLPQMAMLGLHLALSVAALLALRSAIQLSLLNEIPDPVSAEPLLCAHCGQVVPDAAFCAACGAATRASSRSSRRFRRRERPVPVGEGTAVPDLPTGQRNYPAAALPATRYTAPALRTPAFVPVLGSWTAVIAAAAGVSVAVTAAITTPASPYLCPPQCGRPPHAAPVSVLPRFAPADDSFSVAYPAPDSAYDVTTGERAVTARFTAGDGGVMQMFSEPAEGRTPREIVLTALRKAYPDAAVAYEIPNAMVGYQRGFGAVADDWPQSSLAGYRRIRLLVLGAVKNDLALVAFAVGPERAFRPGFGPGPPSGANLQLAMDMGKYVNSFRWRGDPPR